MPYKLVLVVTVENMNTLKMLPVVLHNQSTLINRVVMEKILFLAQSLRMEEEVGETPIVLMNPAEQEVQEEERLKIISHLIVRLVVLEQQDKVMMAVLPQLMQRVAEVAEVEAQRQQELVVEVQRNLDMEEMDFHHL